MRFVGGIFESPPKLRVHGIEPLLVILDVDTWCKHSSGQKAFSSSESHAYSRWSQFSLGFCVEIQIRVRVKLIGRSSVATRFEEGGAPKRVTVKSKEPALVHLLELKGVLTQTHAAQRGGVRTKNYHSLTSNDC